MEESRKAFGGPELLLRGRLPKNGVQFMVKDLRKYASTGGWGFAQFDNGKLASEAVHKHLLRAAMQSSHHDDFCLQPLCTLTSKKAIFSFFFF